MSANPLVKPTHKPIKDYYAELQAYHDQGVTHEMAVRSAFQNLLATTARKRGWTLIPEQPVKINSKTVRPDATLRDIWQLKHGYWEAKDTADDLDTEIRKKRTAGYPFTNIIFEDTRRAVLFQNGQEVFEADLSNARQLADLLNVFLAYEAPAIEGFERAVAHFSEQLPELAKGLNEKIKQAHDDNRAFQAAFEAFFELCRNSLNPNLSRNAVDEMLIQHLLTERLMRTVFDNPDFVRRNVIAAEVEKVIDALTSPYFNRQEFLGALDRFYEAIEGAAGDLGDFDEKQRFLNTVYERFFQGYSVRRADTLGIVYTPPEIVDFMCASVEEALREEFGVGLGHPEVNVLDPCTGTGSFIVNLLRRVPKPDLKRVYAGQLFANEVMLMPYYIASLNIEHAYHDLTGEYAPFEGMAFVDTLDLVERQQPLLPYFAERNAERVERQKQTPITVILGNPPYNVGQINENDNNKNRVYEVIDSRVSETYAADSTASNKNALFDAYVKFFRWATDRLGDRDGIVCFVSNNSFVDQIAFDGMRKHLLADFTRLYHVDLHGNVRQNPKLSGTTHNVFGIQVGVGITVAVRKASHRKPMLHYHRVPEFWRKEEKLGWLAERNTMGNVPLRRLTPDERHTWLVPEHAEAFTSFLPIGTQEVKSARVMVDAEAIFRVFSNGVKTNRDRVVYDFDKQALVKRVSRFVEDYNSEVDRYRRAGAKASVDDFVSYDRIKWSRDLKQDLMRGNYAEFDEAKVRASLYRPYCKRHLFFDRILNEEVYVFPSFYPSAATEAENCAISLTTLGSEKPFMTLATNKVADMHLVGAGSGAQCFPFYVYNEDGSKRRENVTDWALAQFREHYSDQKIGKWDIFYYVYGLLHHPGYREKYADNLKRELPRLPLAPDFWAFSKAGRELAEWHLNYEDVEPYDLRWLSSEDEPLSYRVEKMRLNKDKTQLKVNPTLTLAGIPPKVFDYRLGNRSALEWVIDQYRVKEDKRSGIVSDPNNPDDEEYIVRLVGQVVRVSLETCRIVDALPEDFGG